MRACHSKSQLDTEAVIILLVWPEFKAVAKELQLFEQLPKGEKMCMKTTPTGTYEPPDHITVAWVINYHLIYANTHILSPLMNTSIITLKPTIVTTQLEASATIEAAKKYLSVATTMVVMDPYEAKVLMRFNSTVFFLWSAS